jgi:hypothetical protein
LESQCHHIVITMSCQCHATPTLRHGTEYTPPRLCLPACLKCILSRTKILKPMNS